MKLQFLHQEGVAAATTYEAERNRLNKKLEAQVEALKLAQGAAGDEACSNVRDFLAPLEDHFVEKIREASARQDEIGFADYQLYNFAYNELREQVLNLQLEALLELKSAGGNA
ncbi:MULTISPECIES: hypothetical protein [Xanthomonas]|uniref:Uncharacterized protein n=1 Tax=Xanthomonas dyei TaxID=743699 RepID=A0ABZ0DC19_9XANT|nr:hypothetical protein [Xanthomonas dyei]WOB27745.1 hypothetical protein NYR99_07405 [Xanthomonas dyei]WOB55367.1 hypothetical protein NYR95_07410 [Xanthomonas dyei]